MLCGNKGYLSQFVNFKTFRHDNAGDDKRGRSIIILGGVSRQILQKYGVRIWWVDIPKSLPLPSIFVGVDVFHTPRVYDERENKRVGKSSCAAIIVQVIREGSEAIEHIEMYIKTYKRAPGKEYELGDALENRPSLRLCKNCKSIQRLVSFGVMELVTRPLIMPLTKSRVFEPCSHHLTRKRAAASRVNGRCPYPTLCAKSVSPPSFLRAAFQANLTGNLRRHQGHWWKTFRGCAIIYFTSMDVLHRTALPSQFDSLPQSTTRE
jgi:hypothetical protein